MVGRVIVRPVLPERIAGLRKLSRNLWWSWNPEAVQLFADLDPPTWKKTGNNPVLLLEQADERRIAEAAENPRYLERYDRVMADLEAYLNPESTWFTSTYPSHRDGLVAYFAAEFGLHEVLPLYSGGLGVLSGDHLKTASDLGLPLVGVGLLYNHGYFVQHINADGWQEASYERLPFAAAPMERAVDGKGQEVVVQVELHNRTVHARVWRVQVGRVDLYLLDTDVEHNAPEDRTISTQLYGGDIHMRLAQEKILGLGGVRALRRLGLKPVVWHMNEGHSAFITLEILRELCEEEGLAWREACEALAPGVCFTTHTPVPAGHDVFSADMMEQHFWGLRSALGMTRQEFMALGRAADDPEGPFSLTVLALHLARHRNAVSKLHGRVSRRLWSGVWPELPVAEVPIRHITNGVHAPSWVAPEMGRLYDRYVGPEWRETPDDPAVWEGLKDLPDEELWGVHLALKEKMIVRIRHAVDRRLRRLAVPASERHKVDRLLDPDILTIGFARRFATYKRATLIFSDLERLVEIVRAEGREVQLLFAGKAHPADRPGQELIQQIHELSRTPELEGRLILVEGYDLDIARHLVQGVDVWLNNPRRPLEASGTSGQKAAMNGVLNFSVLDGWWAEGYNGKNGWSIGEDRHYENQEEQDLADASSLYATLENSIVPLYYDQDEHGIPRGWVARMKESIRSLTPVFCTHRMLRDYIRHMYVPAARGVQQVRRDGFALARRMAAWKLKMERRWRDVAVEVEAPPVQEVVQGEPLAFRGRARLGDLTPEEVRVELYGGRVGEDDTIEDPVTAPMECRGENSGTYLYEGCLTPQVTGDFGFGLRIRPIPPAESQELAEEPPFIRWAR